LTPGTYLRGAFNKLQLIGVQTIPLLFIALEYEKLAILARLDRPPRTATDRPVLARLGLWHIAQFCRKMSARACVTPLAPRLPVP